MGRTFGSPGVVGKISEVVVSRCIYLGCGRGVGNSRSIGEGDLCDWGVTRSSGGVGGFEGPDRSMGPARGLVGLQEEVVCPGVSGSEG